MKTFQNLSADYQEKCLKKWMPILNEGGKITDEYTAIATALVLENTHQDYKDHGLIKENYSVAGMGAQVAGTQGGGALGTAFDYGPNDARIPTIVIPTVRRVFPDLLAHKVVGVQPMNGPVGFAFAFRALYGTNGQFQTAGDHNFAENTEIGYNNLDSTFTGASGNSTTGSMWAAYAGNPGGLYGNSVYADGQGAGLSTSEWAKIGTDMPMAKFRMEKGVVVATERKMAAHWSLELAEDMQKMHGLNVDNEMVNIISYELQAEMDRQLLTEMVKSAIVGGKTSTWTPVSADGRNQMERIGTLYTQILDKRQEVAVRTRRGPANFAIVSPKVAALIERFQDFKNWSGEDTSKVDTNQIGVSEVGTLRGGMKVYRDTFAAGNYILLGYKGPNPYDSGIIYCPYIPVQLMRAVNPTDFSPVLGARTRYGILNHLFGSDNFYHFMKISDLTSTVLSSENSRVFTY